MRRKLCITSCDTPMEQHHFQRLKGCVKHRGKFVSRHFGPAQYERSGDLHNLERHVLRRINSELQKRRRLIDREREQYLSDHGSITTGSLHPEYPNLAYLPEA